MQGGGYGECEVCRVGDMESVRGVSGGGCALVIWMQ